MSNNYPNSLDSNALNTTLEFSNRTPGTIADISRIDHSWGGISTERFCFTDGVVGYDSNNEMYRILDKFDVRVYTVDQHGVKTYSSLRDSLNIEQLAVKCYILDLTDGSESSVTIGMNLLSSNDSASQQYWVMGATPIYNKLKHGHRYVARILPKTESSIAPYKLDPIIIPEFTATDNRFIKVMMTRGFDIQRSTSNELWYRWFNEAGDSFEFMCRAYETNGVITHKGGLIPYNDIF